MDTIDRYEFSKEKEYGLTHIYTATNVIPIVKTFMNLALFAKKRGEEKTKTRKIHLGDLKDFHIEMFRFSYFDYKVFLAILKLIDNNEEVNIDSFGDYIQTFSVDEIYKLIGLKPGLCRKSEKRKEIISTLKTISEMTFVKTKNGSITRTKPFYELTIHNQQEEESFDFEFKTFNFKISFEFVYSVRKESKELNFVGMVAMAKLNLLGPVAANAYIQMLANSGYTRMYFNAMVERLGLESYTKKTHQNEQIYRAFTKLEESGLIKKGWTIHKTSNIPKYIEYELIKENKPTTEKSSNETEKSKAFAIIFG